MRKSTGICFQKVKTQNSISLRLGDEDGQNSLLQKPGKWFWNHFCFFRKCVMVHSLVGKWTAFPFFWLVFWLVEGQESKFYQCAFLCSLLHLRAQKWGKTSMSCKWRNTAWQKKVSLIWFFCQRKWFRLCPYLSSSSLKPLSFFFLWSSTLRTIFGSVELLELANYIVNSWSWRFKKQNLSSQHDATIIKLYSI